MGLSENGYGGYHQPKHDQFDRESDQQLERDDNLPHVRRVEVAPATCSFGRSSCQRFDNDEPVSDHNDNHHDGGSCERRQKGILFLYLGDSSNKAMYVLILGAFLWSS